MGRADLFRARAIALIAVLAVSCSTDPWMRSVEATAADPPDMREGPHRVALLEDGRTALELRMRLLREARRSIAIQTFILSEDPVALLVIHELVRASQRGVEVRLIGDAMFTPPAARALLTAAGPGVRSRLYNPAPHPSEVTRLLGQVAVSGLHVNQRMHNKILVVDDRIAITGGRNIADEYYDEDPELNFLDLDIAVEGPVVQDVMASFEEYWSSSAPLPAQEAAAMPLASADLLARYPEQGAIPEPELDWHTVGPVGFWADPPGKPAPDTDPRSLAIRLAAYLTTARDSVLIQSPYLVMSSRAQALFHSLSDKGVELVVSTNSLAATDNLLSYAHSLRQRRIVLQDLDFDVREMKPYPADLRRYMPGYDELLARGASRPRLSLHSKALVLDGTTALVGSYNLDPRSAASNTEVGVIVPNADFAAHLRAKIERDMSPGNSWVVSRRWSPMPVAMVQELMEEVNDLARSTTSLDLWPIRYSSLFQLRPGATPVSRHDPRFYEAYLDVGLFPGISTLDPRLVLVELTRALSGVVQPLI